MDTLQACNLLGISPGASEDDVKKAFKKKALEYHPDKNKAPGAEDTFKKINEANQFLEKNGTHPPQPRVTFRQAYTDGPDLSGFAEQIRRSIHINRGFSVEHLVVNVKISFVEHVRGTSKKIQYSRNIKCAKCNGNGNIVKNKSVCSNCQGHLSNIPCGLCSRTGYVGTTTSCSSCNGLSYTKQNRDLTVNINQGSNTKIALKDQGNWRGFDVYDDLIISLDVEKDPDMTLSGYDVISVVRLTLLEALQGTKKKLRTVDGEKTLSFKPLIKNKDMIKVGGFGVKPFGTHQFIIEIDYPEDVSGIIELLQKENVEPEELATSEEDTGLND